MNGRFCRIPAGVVIPVVMPACRQAGMDDTNHWIPACVYCPHGPIVYSDSILCGLSYMKERISPDITLHKNAPTTPAIRRKWPRSERPVAELAARDTLNKQTFELIRIEDHCAISRIAPLIPQLALAG